MNRLVPDFVTKELKIATAQAQPSGTAALARYLEAKSAMLTMDGIKAADTETPEQYQLRLVRSAACQLLLAQIQADLCSPPELAQKPIPQ